MCHSHEEHQPHFTEKATQLLGQSPNGWILRKVQTLHPCRISGAEALAIPYVLAISDLGDAIQSIAVQREAGKVAAQLEGQRLNGGRLQVEVGALEGGIQQAERQTMDEPEGERGDQILEWG